MSCRSSGKSIKDISGLEGLARCFALSVHPGDRFYLTGELGTGKSTFVRAFLRALGVLGPIPSPSFIMDAEYAASGLEVHHVDLFRLDCTRRELVVLGLEEVLDTADVVLVEWADRLPDLESRGGVEISLGMCADPACREVSVEDRRVAGD